MAPLFLERTHSGEEAWGERLPYSGRMRHLTVLLALAACAPTNRPDELELTYYYLRY